jgi:hypothetical protein
MVDDWVDSRAYVSCGAAWLSAIQRIARVDGKLTSAVTSSALRERARVVDVEIVGVETIGDRPSEPSSTRDDIMSFLEDNPTYFGRDVCYDDLTPAQGLEAWLEWNGICRYTSRILDVMRELGVVP